MKQNRTARVAYYARVELRQKETLRLIEQRQKIKTLIFTKGKRKNSLLGMEIRSSQQR